MKSLLLCLSVLLLTLGCASPQPVVNPRTPFPPLNLEDTVPDHIIGDLLVENHFPRNVITNSAPRYTLVTREWIEVFGSRLQEAATVYGETNAAVDKTIDAANYAFRHQYPRRFMPFGDRYRIYPFYGVAFGEVQRQDGRVVNFYVIRNSSGSLGLRLWNPRLRLPWHMTQKEAETATQIRY